MILAYVDVYSALRFYRSRFAGLVCRLEPRGITDGPRLGNHHLWRLCRVALYVCGDVDSVRLEGRPIHQLFQSLSLSVGEIDPAASAADSACGVGPTREA